jgi:2,3-bisphosphoglycerate-independent phosphoglycerate mutase
MCIVAEGFRSGRGRRFTEQEASQGGLRHLRSVDLMPLMLAHARRLRKIDGEGKHQEP